MFYADHADDVLHTDSTHGRGVKVMLDTHSMLDLTPQGRDEQERKFSMK
jgi:predicted dithiol-disulfide oxidoreductase (DUF899 family)